MNNQDNIFINTIELINNFSKINQNKSDFELNKVEFMYKIGYNMNIIKNLMGKQFNINNQQIISNIVDNKFGEKKQLKKYETEYFNVLNKYSF